MIPCRWINSRIKRGALWEAYRKKRVGIEVFAKPLTVETFPKHLFLPDFCVRLKF
jgi:hypothetical protein